MTGTVAGQLEAEVHVGIELGNFGNWMAFEQKRVYLICRRMLQDPDEADSATQDVFLKAYRALTKSYTAATALENPAKWVTRIAINTCLDRLRSKAWKFWSRRPSAKEEQLILEMTAHSSPDAERQLFSNQIALRLEHALTKLSARQRAVFTLRHYDSFSLDEISLLLNLDTGTVKAHLFRAIGKLRDELKDLYVPVEIGGFSKADSHPLRRS